MSTCLYNKTHNLSFPNVVHLEYGFSVYASLISIDSARNANDTKDDIFVISYL